MLTYQDCLGMSPLTQEEIAAIARHEHVPEIIALELGGILYETQEGKRRIQRIIAENAQEACRFSEMDSATALGPLLHHFIETHIGERDPSDPDCAIADPALRERLESHLIPMLLQFGIEYDSAQAAFGPEMQVAQVCCLACPYTALCRRYLSTSTDSPARFCPNASLFNALARKLRSARALPTGMLSRVRSGSPDFCSSEKSLPTV